MPPPKQRKRAKLSLRTKFVMMKVSPLLSVISRTPGVMTVSFGLGVLKGVLPCRRFDPEGFGAGAIKTIKSPQRGNVLT